MIDVVKDAALGTVGIQANNLIGNTLSAQVLKVTGNKRSAVKVATGVLIPGILSFFMPRWKRPLCYMGSSSVAIEATKALNRHVYPQLGNLGVALSTSDGEQIAAGSSGGSQVPSSLQYNSDVRYLPGGTFAERPSPSLGAFVSRYRAGMKGMGAISDQAGIYDGVPSVY